MDSSHDLSMRVLKILAGVVAAFMAGPVILGTVISVQAGCFLCFEGDGAGSAAEKWLNLGFVAILAGAAAAALWLHMKKKRSSH